MSSNHKAPLAAFVVVALACVVVLATNSMRSYARDAWHQFAAPVVSGLTLVPSLGGGDSSPAPVAHDVADDATPAAQPPAAATPAVAVTAAKPAKQHHHRHHTHAKTTPATKTTPAPPTPPTPQPATPPPATPAWPSYHQPSWSANVHQSALPASTHPAANQGNHFGQSKQLTGLNHGQSNQSPFGMRPGRGVAKGLQKTAKTPFAATDKLSQSPNRGFGLSSAHVSMFGSHRGH